MRRKIQPEELQPAASLRLLTGLPSQNAHVVCVDSGLRNAKAGPVSLPAAGLCLAACLRQVSLGAAQRQGQRADLAFPLACELALSATACCSRCCWLRYAAADITCTQSLSRLSDSRPDEELVWAQVPCARRRDGFRVSLVDLQPLSLQEWALITGSYQLTVRSCVCVDVNASCWGLTLCAWCVGQDAAAAGGAAAAAAVLCDSRQPQDGARLCGHGQRHLGRSSSSVIGFGAARLHCYLVHERYMQQADHGCPTLNPKS